MCHKREGKIQKQDRDGKKREIGTHSFLYRSRDFGGLLFPLFRLIQENPLKRGHKATKDLKYLERRSKAVPRFIKSSNVERFRFGNGIKPFFASFFFPSKVFLILLTYQISIRATWCPTIGQHRAITSPQTSERVVFAAENPGH